MSKIHVNPETGESGQCSAKVQCRFGGENVVAVHFESADEAQAFTEKVLHEKYGLFDAKTKKSKRSKDRSEIDNTSNLSLGDKDYGQFSRFQDLKDHVYPPEMFSSELSAPIEKFDMMYYSRHNEVFSNNVERLNDLLEKKYGIEFGTDALRSDWQSEGAGVEVAWDLYKVSENLNKNEYFKDRIDSSAGMDVGGLLNEEDDFKRKDSVTLMASINYPLKASLAGEKIHPVYEKNLKAEWNNPNNPYGKKANEKIIEDCQKEIDSFNNTGEFATEEDKSGFIEREYASSPQRYDAARYMYHQNQLDKALTALDTNGLSSPGFVIAASKQTEKEIIGGYLIPTQQDRIEADNALMKDKRVSSVESIPAKEIEDYRTNQTYANVYGRMYQDGFVPATDAANSSFEASYTDLFETNIDHELETKELDLMYCKEQGIESSEAEKALQKAKLDKVTRGRTHKDTIESALYNGDWDFGKNDQRNYETIRKNVRQQMNSYDQKN